MRRVLAFLLIGWTVVVICALLSPASVCGRVMDAAYWASPSAGDALARLRGGDDRRVHGIICAVEALLLAGFLRRSGITRLKAAVLTAIPMTGCTLLFEILQQEFVSGRSFQVSDLCGNQVGLAAGVIAGIGLRIASRAAPMV